ncbi:hypothetical protein BC832DRAFT_104592 [Gaertneriomyces semiglobifer]|nr:hypothetical protein BC832DRAFT_104592 [Gaertneriomyces semiglobifer]
MWPRAGMPGGVVGSTATSTEQPVLSHTFVLKNVSTTPQYTEWKAFANGPGGLVRLSYVNDQTDGTLRLSLDHTRAKIYHAAVVRICDSEGKMVQTKPSRGRFVEALGRLKWCRHGECSQGSAPVEVRVTFERPEAVLEKWNDRRLGLSPLGGLLGDATWADVYLSLQSESTPLVGGTSPTTASESDRKMGSEALEKIVQRQADNEVFAPAVQAVLAAQSTYFKTMFSGTFREGARTAGPSKITINGPFHPDDIPAVLAHYMSLVYTGSTCIDIAINGRIRAQLFSLAHLTCMSRICVELAHEIMQKSDMTPWNLCEWLRFTHLYATVGGGDESSAPHLLMLSATRKFFEWRAEIIHTDEFKRMMADPECESLKNDLFIQVLQSRCP